jgi:segregation and condensation protein A
VNLTETTDGASERTDFLQVAFDRFQGPLDLLLHLIRSQDIDIFDIPISTITKQFLVAIKTLAVTDLDGAGEFLEMAATLIRIKAQMLLPRPMEDDEDDPRAELVRRLLEYEQIREITQRMRAAEADKARRFAKGFIAARPGRATSDLPLETTWTEVYAAALLVEMPVPGERLHRIAHRSNVSMQEKVALILDTLRNQSRVEFSKLVTDFGDRMHGVMTFLAGLELTRRRILFLRQTRPFSDLWIYRRNDQAEAEPYPEDDSNEQDETVTNNSVAALADEAAELHSDADQGVDA